MTDPLIEIRGGSFGYGDDVVLSGVDLRVEPGTLAGIVGPNGSGKTTLLRGLLGLIEPLAGSARRAGVPVGYVPQRESLDPVYPLTVEEVVRMGAYGRLRGLRRVTRADRHAARDSLESVELSQHASALFASLSGGQRQRALIARALLARPRVLVLDEPTNGVDARARETIFALLHRLHRDENLAVLIVSHHVATLREAVDLVYWVSSGRVVAGPPDELLDPTRLDRLFAGGSAVESRC